MISGIGTGLALLAGLGGGSAVAMTSSNASAIACSVERAAKLPAGMTADGLCAAVRKAVAPALVRAGHASSALSVRITIDSERKLSAVATLNGTALPEQHVGASDHALSLRAADMLGAAIAAQVTSGRQ